MFLQENCNSRVGFLLRSSLKKKGWMREEQELQVFQLLSDYNFFHSTVLESST